ncbi:uncharacterized protein LOC124415097 isoform X2 [Diprion similis]|uniref:uncharacterized protein LOC124415097 isoform X2 n=1 Tax=Diprion similis TaxID=362088 RepID=UPI001EF7E4A2|nr:uncharacterized protein LOC124415097 isoform X2 [Diprion similis]
MPGKVKVKILAGRNLPVMDRSSDTTDAYVEIKFGNTTYKTDVCRKSLNPQWNSEWYRFEVDEAELQDEPLQIRLMDHDTYSANDAIGKVYLDLNPLLLPGTPLPVKNMWTLEASMSSSSSTQGDPIPTGSVMNGWIPVYDTMHGIRGEVNIIVKVELFSDFNKFRQSSCGVQFFCSPIIPHGYHAQIIHGFVEELVVNDDPEYKWIDKIRTPRASNEARQTLFFKLSGEVQRKIGLKALDLGGNAVIGYHQCFDLEGESGIVARGIGTAVTLVKMHDSSSVPAENLTSEELALLGLPRKASFECLELDESVPLLSHSPDRSQAASLSSLQTTKVSSKFPGYGKTLKKRSKPLIVVPSYRSAGSSGKMLRNLSQQSSFNNLRRSFDSNISLPEDTDELSLRSILAQEDMRGEIAGNRFSRGLKNLRYLPQSMLSKRVSQLRARFSDSFDEDQSDLDSTFSSTWSVSSESVRSSISDLYSLGRNKKSSSKRNSSDGMAALLIRSVHAGLALDSVKEDHESPAPSPIRIACEEFEARMAESEAGTKSSDRKEKIAETETEANADLTSRKSSEKFTKSSTPKRRLREEEDVSSDESDTESSEDEPSESSTNYNILDDSLTHGEPGSPPTGDGKITSIGSKLEVKEKESHSYFDHDAGIFTALPTGEKKNPSVSSEPMSSSTESRGSDIWFEKRNSIEEAELIPRRAASPSFLPQNYEEIQTQRPIRNDSYSSRDENLDAAAEAAANDGDTIAITSSMTAKETEFLDRQERFDNPEDSKPAAASTPTEDQSCEIFFPDMDPWVDAKTVSLQRSASLNERAIRRFVTPGRISLKKKSESFKAETKRKLSIFKTLNISPGGKHAADSKIITKEGVEKVLSKNHEEAARKAEKNLKKVERNETVIYRGSPRGREKPEPLQKIKPVAIVIDSTLEEDRSHLSVPLLKVTEVNTKSNFGSEEGVVKPKELCDQRREMARSAEELARADRLRSKQKRQCMLELIKIIDTKMLVHSMRDRHRNDSSRSRKHRREKVAASVTPSPDSIRKHRHRRRTSRSKSPEDSSIQSYGTGSSLARQNYSSASSIGSRHALFTPQSIGGGDEAGGSRAGFTVNREKQGIHSAGGPETLEKTEGCLIAIAPPIVELEAETEADDDDRKDAVKTLQATVSTPRIDLPQNPGDSKLVEVELSELSFGSGLERLTNAGSNLLTPEKLTIVSVVRKSHSECNLREAQEGVGITNNTNTANTTDNSCVPCYPDPRRQQPDVAPPPGNPSPAPPSTPTPAGAGNRISKSPVTKANSAVPIHRRSSDSDLSITPKGYYRKRNSLTGSDRSSMGGYLRPVTAVVRPMNQEALDMLEYPFITMQQYPPGFILHLGGTVSARSVKLLERISNLEEPESRDAWWTEIRMEVRSHARALACNVVLGYREETSICDDVCVLSAAGTAAVINLQNTSQEPDNPLISRIHQREITTTSLDRTDFEREKGQQKAQPASTTKSEKGDKSDSDKGEGKNDQTEETAARDVNGVQDSKTRQPDVTEQISSHSIPLPPSSCSVCHLPYSESSVPFRVKVLKCAICRRGKVPDILFTTIELPESIPITGRGCVVQATVCRPKRDLRGELNAKEISDGLPFLEYELHSLLLNKIKVRSMNALFGLRVQVSIGERLLIGMATGTAVYLAPLPTPAVPKVTAGNSWSDEQKLADIQKSLIETVKKNREFYQLKSLTDMENGRVTTSDTDESEDEMPEIDLGAGNKDACVLEVDDMEEVDKISMLMENRPPDGFHVVNTQTIPGLEDLEIVRNLQMFTQLWRAKIPVGQPASVSTKYFGRLLQSVYFKLRKMVPCALCDLQFKVELPEPDEIQLSVVGMALGLGEPTKLNKYKRKVLPHSMSRDQVKKTDENDLIFSLDEDHVVPENAVASGAPNTSSLHSLGQSGSLIQRQRPRSPLRTRVHTLHKHKHMPLKERYGVDITPLSYMPGGRIERYLGNLNFFFIRESTAIREGGGLSGFVHSFVTEVLAIVRAHVTALGGNAMVAYFMTQLVLCHSPHKNQGQCLINVGGDVVSVSYFADDRHVGNLAG